MTRPELVAILIAFLVAGAGVGAGDLEPQRTGPDGGQRVVQESTHPLAAQQLTQSLEPYTVVDGTSVACIPAVIFDHQWWRLFDLDGEFGLEGEFCVEDIDYAIQSCLGPIQNLTAEVYCLDDGLPFVRQSLTLVGTSSIPQPDAQLEFFNIEVGGCCDSATQSMAVALVSDDCVETGTCIYLFIGMNDLGQTAPTYLSTEDCGILDPIDVASFGFPDAHLLMVVNGQDESPPDDNVPAASRPGAVVLILVLFLAGCAYVLRRRAAF